MITEKEKALDLAINQNDYREGKGTGSGNKPD
jgi:hypothetical protein